MHLQHTQREHIGITDNVIIELHNHVTDEDTTITMHNRNTLDSLDVIAALLTQQPNAVGITHFSVGTGQTPPTVPDGEQHCTDTALEAEIFRGAITRAAPGTARGEAVSEYFLQRAQANTSPDGKIYEIGLWCGDVLFARAVIPGGLPKTKDYSATITWANLLGVVS